MNNDQFKFVTLDELASEHISAPQYSYWRSVFRKFFSSKVTIVIMIVAVTVVGFAMIYPLFSNYSPIVAPNINKLEMWFNSPSAEYWFGTDDKGNSLFDAVWAGLRVSIMIASISTAITMVVGVVVGAFWGYSKKVDRVMMEVYNIIANVPFQLLIIIIMYVIGRGFWQLIFALSITSWMGTAYFIRVQVMIIRDREHNLASRCLGTPMTRMINRNILPYLISVIVTLVSRDVPAFISFEVFLSYLGIGLNMSTPSIGRMISSYNSYMINYPYLFWLPVATLAIVTISLYVVGQAFADASDPKTHM
jgi:oligopeptide transport system permease protein